MSACGCLIPSSGRGGLDAANLELLSSEGTSSGYSERGKLAANRGAQASEGGAIRGLGPTPSVKRSGALCWRT